MRINGAKIVVETLIEQGCDTIFGYPGGQVINLFDELWQSRDRIRHILTAHEEGAAHAADGYARSTGKVGVVIATSGPGATNLVTGIATAYLDSVPLVAITGNVPCDLIGRDSFQEVDIVGISMPVTKHNFIVKDVNKLADTIRTAFQIAKSGRPGPVLVDIPKDVQCGFCEFEPQSKPVQPFAMHSPSEARVDRAAEMIEQAQRPYIYFGGGVIASGAGKEVMALSERIDAPMGCSLMGLSAVPYDHPKFLGMQGMHGHYASSVAEDEADLVIALGARFSDRATGKKQRFAKNFRIIHIDVDNAELHKNIPATLAIQGDLKETAARLLKKLPQQRRPEWEKRVGELKEEEKRRVEHALKLEREKNCANCAAECAHAGIPAAERLTPFEIIDAVSARATVEDNIVTDVGQHQMWTAQRYPLKRPRSFLTSGGLGTMGYGMGAAIGSAVATGRRSILFTGDGSFGMNLNELATAVTENIPLIIVIMNNGVLGMVRQWQTLFFDKHYSNTTLSRKTDFVKVAEAFGARGARARNTDELSRALDEAFGQNGTFLIDCAVDCDDFVLPMLPPGGSIDDIITEIK